MLHFISKKLRNQKLLNGCLFFGIVILIAVLSLIPMFEGGALDDVIQYDFENAAYELDEFPAILTSKAIFSKDESKNDKHAESLAEVNAEVDAITGKWNRYLELPVVSIQKIYKVTGGRFDGDLVANTPTRLFPPSLGGRTVGDHVSLSARSKAQISHRCENSSMPRSASATRNSSSNTTVEMTSSASPLCRGTPNFSS